MTTLTPYPLTLGALETLTLLPIRPRRVVNAGARPCPGRLLALVCDAARRFLVAAEAAMAAGWSAIAAANVRRAQGILLEMLASVERSAVPNAPDLADALARLCQLLIDRLFEAVAADDVARVRDARRLLTGLRDTWTGAVPA